MDKCVSFLKKIWKKVHSESVENNQLVSLANIATEVQIPVFIKPESALAPIQYEKILVALSHNAFVDNLFNSDKAEVLRFDKLRYKSRVLRLPSPLNIWAREIFSDYVQCLKDPYLFENALDLLDIFTNFYNLITEDLIKDQETFLEDAKRRLAKEWRCLSYLSKEQLEDLVSLLNLLQCALNDRTKIGFIEIDKIQRYSIFRVALNQLTCSADVPLMCALDFLSNYLDVMPQSNSSSSGIKISGISKLTHDIGATSQIIPFEKVDQYYSSINLNLKHLFYPEFLGSQFHEVAHVLCEILKNEGCDYDHRCNCPRSNCFRHPLYNQLEEIDEYSVNRAEEIYAEMVYFRLIFEEDPKTYFRELTASYFLDPKSIDKSIPKTRRDLMEILIRGFLASDPARKEAKDEKLYDCDNYSDITNDQMNRAFKRFVRAISDSKIMLFNGKAMFKSKEEKTELEYSFKSILNTVYPMIYCFWKEIDYNVKTLLYGSDDPKHYPISPGKKGSKTRNEINRQIKKSLSDGNPIARAKYKNNQKVINAKDMEVYGHLHALYVVKKILYYHMKKIYSDENFNASKAVYLFRNVADGKVDFKQSAKGIKGLNPFLLDRNYCGLFSADMNKRREIMLSRITVTKTFWDISTNIRARKLKKLLEIHKQQPEDTNGL